MKTITITNKGGAVKIETTGFAGRACQDATRDLERELGLTDATDTPTPDLHRAAPTSTVAQKRGA